MTWYHAAMAKLAVRALDAPADDAVGAPGRAGAGELKTEAQAAAAYSIRAGILLRFLAGSLAAIACAGAGLAARGDVAAAIMLCVAIAIGGLIIMADLRARIIPWETCVAVLVLGTAWQLCISPAAFVSAAAFAVAVWAAFILLDKLLVVLGSSAPMGGGDKRMIGPVVLACGFPWAAYGLALGCAVTFVWAAIRRVVDQKKMTRGTMLPFGPALAIALVAGMAMSVQSGTNAGWQ